MQKTFFSNGTRTEGFTDNSVKNLPEILLMVKIVLINFIFLQKKSYEKILIDFSH